MRKLQLVFVAVMLAGGSSIVAAQNAPQQGQRGGSGRMMAALMQGITLSAEQQVKVDSISKMHAAERQTIMQDQSADQEARRAKMHDLMIKQTAEIKAVLTDDQKKTFEKNAADMQARMQGSQRPPQH